MEFLIFRVINTALISFCFLVELFTGNRRAVMILSQERHKNGEETLWPLSLSQRFSTCEELRAYLLHDKEGNDHKYWGQR